jgi:Fe-S cluster assembly scaffold protein SufB
MMQNTSWVAGQDVNVLHILANTTHPSPIQIPLDKTNILVKIEKDTSCVLYFVLKDGNYQNRIIVELVGKNAQVDLLGVFYGEPNFCFDIATSVIHSGQNTRSQTIIKGVLKQNASSFYNGMIRVEKNASAACASLEYGALLLANSAKAKPIPSLEILNNDVQVSHAVTVGRVSDEDLFYLNTRGLSDGVAKEMITSGFLSKVESMIGQVGLS